MTSKVKLSTATTTKENNKKFFIKKMAVEDPNQSEDERIINSILRAREQRAQEAAADPEREQRMTHLRRLRDEQRTRLAETERDNQDLEDILRLLRQALETGAIKPKETNE